VVTVARLRLPSGAAAMLLLFTANAGLTVSEFAGIGASMEIFGVSRDIAVPLALAGIWTVTVLAAQLSVLGHRGCRMGG
jgi:hypothetical protein